MSDKIVKLSNLNKLAKTLDARNAQAINTAKEDIEEIINEAVAELGAEIAGKSNNGHTHEEFVTESEMNTKLEGKSNSDHEHAEIYYDKTEIDTMEAELIRSINGKANSGHGHTEISSKIEELENSITTNVSTLESAIARAKTEAINEAANKDTALHTTISSEIDADVEVERLRAEAKELELQTAINGKAPSSHTHDDRYYTETEIEDKITTINNAIDSSVNTLNTAINTAKAGAISEAKTYADQKITALVDSAPEAMNTLNELAEAIKNHNDDYTAYVATVSSAIATAKADAIADAAAKDTALHTKISAEIDADVKIEKERAEDKEAELQGEITVLENNITTINESIVDINESLKTVNAIKLNGYSIWVGTTEELEAIEARDPNTLYFEIGDESGDKVVQVDVTNGVLQLTTDKYQKTTMITGTRIVFPTVNKFTEIHLYFDAEIDMDLSLPDNCRWRVDPNIEAGKSYEIVATYNTIQWLVNIIVYS